MPDIENSQKAAEKGAERVACEVPVQQRRNNRDSSASKGSKGHTRKGHREKHPENTLKNPETPRKYLKIP